jgi:hypothetical protein
MVSQMRSAHKNAGEYMPFFLVTQTSLVDAHDEQEAAQKGIDRLRSGGQVTVAVKSDETTITHIVVPAMMDEPRPLSTSAGETIDLPPAAVAIPQPAFAAPATRKQVLKRMIADALALLGRRA